MKCDHVDKITISLCKSLSFIAIYIIYWTVYVLLRG